MADLEEASAPYQPRKAQRMQVSDSELRANLQQHLNEVSVSHVPLLVTRGDEEPVVVLALSEYESLQETLHLLQSPANAEHLRKSLAQAENGDFVTFGSDE